MSKLSDLIEEFIKSLMSDAENGVIEIQRNELAQYFNCAPSQINYVLTTRFSNDKGYYIESKRGGGGYIKIVKVNINNNQHIRNVILNIIGESITKTRAYSIIESFKEKGLITKREMNIMKMAISDRALAVDPKYKNMLRANILKDMLLILLDE
ncbi:CtsR family transcriptional regulator [Caldisalinibacter kiritimatiensis]|uniref:Transcriptional regulator CtsR n=1 Tax=Caldisalinibacter kiritimatiensis TaxID=1304284 RepID=R1CVH2_9FIRM|nr:CtsR family transcriptional regulator [Caldisalinibacter kiritimatiensis]EOD00644.1 Transcriptional regulator CtsR [Caldisalinibacter kiritimatiensis]